MMLIDDMICWRERAFVKGSVTILCLMAVFRINRFLTQLSVTSVLCGPVSTWRRIKYHNVKDSC